MTADERETLPILIKDAERRYGKDVEVALVFWDTDGGGPIYEQDGWLGGLLLSSPAWREKSADDVVQFAIDCARASDGDVSA